MKGDIFDTDLKQRDISDQDMERAKQMFYLGVEAANDDFNLRVSTVSMGGEILSIVKDDPAMTSLLMEIFESGLSVGERRKREGKEIDT